jgi:hypothetical protein
MESSRAVKNLMDSNTNKNLLDFPQTAPGQQRCGEHIGRGGSE